EADSVRQNPALNHIPSVPVKAPLMAQGAEGAAVVPNEQTAAAANPAQAASRDPASQTTQNPTGPVPGKAQGVNVFNALKDFSTALREGQRTGINDAIDSLDKAFQQVLETRTLVGARMNVLDSGISAAETATVNNA